MPNIFVYDPTAADRQSAVRGIGRYMQILKENFPNWIFSNNLRTTNYPLRTAFINPFFNFLQPPLIMRRIARKQIAVIHDLIPLKYPGHFPTGIKGKINVLLNKLALKNYDLIVTDSNASKSDIIKMLGINENKIKVIYPCLPEVFLNLKSKIPNYQLLTTNYSLYVGDATWNKNLVNLAKAIKIANIPCVFVGKVFNRKTLDPGSLKLDKEVRILKLEKNQISNFKYHNQASNLKYPMSNFFNPWQKELHEFLELTKNDNRFIFPGFIDDYKLFKLYEQAKCNILVSRDEGFGFSYLEAANFGCPSVLANISVLKELAEDSAIFCDPNNPQDIANKIGEIYFNNDLRNKLGLKAQEQSKKYSREKFKKEFQLAINH